MKSSIKFIISAHLLVTVYKISMVKYKQTLGSSHISEGAIWGFQKKHVHYLFFLQTTLLT